MSEDQEFCLKWNNFQANITSEFGSLRDAEDFTDVTIACDGKRIQAHKVVLSACSPFFKELFKTNPCSHPIIFMRDVEACHIILLLEFMYAGQVNVAQTNLSSFLKTAESLKIRGLTDTSENIVNEETDNLNLQQKNTPIRDVKLQILSTNNVSSSQDDLQVQTDSSPPPKKTKTQTDTTNEEYNEKCEISDNTDPIEFLNHSIQPKNELANYLSDDADEKEDDMLTKIPRTDPTTLPEVNIFPKNQYCTREIKQEFATEGKDNRKLHSLDPRPCEECGKVYSNLSNLRQHMRLIHYPTYVQCNLCHKPFKTDLYLRRHVASAHGTFTKNDSKIFSTKFFDVSSVNKITISHDFENNFKVHKGHFT